MLCKTDTESCELLPQISTRAVECDQSQTRLFLEDTDSGFLPFPTSRSLLP